MPKILVWGLEEMREKIQPGKNNQIYLLGTLTSLASRRNSMNILNIYIDSGVIWQLLMII